jgi:lysophospholipase L1-like esterase
MFWYETEVKALENKSLKLAVDAETLFYGSSSIRMWETLGKDLEGFKPANLGFGGSTLAACVWFFERIMAPYHPKRLVIYAGDNDLGDGRHPEEVFIFFQQLMVKIQKRFGNLPCYFISLKPSPSRSYLLNSYKYINQLIQAEIAQNQPCWRYIDVFSQMIDQNNKPKDEYYTQDGLHMNEGGYRLWATIVKQQLNNSINC